MKLKLALSFLLVSLFTSCINASTPTSQPVSKTPSIENIILPTSVPLPDTLPTVIPDFLFVQSCVKIEDQIVSLKDITVGTILLFTDSPENQPFLVDIQTGQRYTLPSETKSPTFLGAQVSPDGNMFAYIEGITDNQFQFSKGILWVVDAHADILAKVPFDNGNFGNNLRWLDNERVVFYIDQTSQDGTVMVVNPFTREQYRISNELPNLLTGDLSWDVDWRVEYNLNLEWVAYLGVTKNPGGGSPIVRDVTTGQTIWQVESESNWEKPVWSPDGSEIAIIVSNELYQSELYLINRSGQAKTVFVEEQRQASAPSWSPDGKYIAFWNNHELMVYDKNFDKVIDLCIRNEYARQLPPIWSYDSQLVGVGVAHGTEMNPIDEPFTLIDIQNGIGYHSIELNTSAYPDIWMNSIQ